MLLTVGAVQPIALHVIAASERSRYIDQLEVVVAVYLHRNLLFMHAHIHTATA